MATLVFGMNVSLDGYVDHLKFGPSSTLFQHYIDQACAQAGSLYGRGLYELMAYWDEDRPDWDAPYRAFAAAWRKQPKWVASRTLTTVGPNATLIDGDLETTVRGLKERLTGEIQVGGPNLANRLSALGLIDEYRLYLHPVVLGHGTPFFVGPVPRLRLTGSEQIDEDVTRLSYVPA